MDTKSNPRAGRARTIAAVLLLGVVAAGGVAEARRPGIRLSRTQARAVFEEVLEAAVALQRTDAQPADANGQIRAWDRKWRARLERLQTDALSYRFEPEGCESHELESLTRGLASDMLSVRGSVYCEYCTESYRDCLVAFGSNAACRDATAIEAHRREMAGLSCEDLPDADGRDASNCGVPVARPEEAESPTSDVSGESATKGR